MAINVQVEKMGGESTASLVRRFSKRVQSAGIIPEVRTRRYKTRSASKLSRQKHALKTISRRARYDELLKLGKITERKPRRGGR